MIIILLIIGIDSQDLGLDGGAGCFFFFLGGVKWGGGR